MKRDTYVSVDVLTYVYTHTFKHIKIFVYTCTCIYFILYIAHENA